VCWAGQAQVSSTSLGMGEQGLVCQASECRLGKGGCGISDALQGRKPRRAARGTGLSIPGSPALGQGVTEHGYYASLAGGRAC